MWYGSRSHPALRGGRWAALLLEAACAVGIWNEDRHNFLFFVFSFLLHQVALEIKIQYFDWIPFQLKDHFHSFVSHNMKTVTSGTRTPVVRFTLFDYYRGLMIMMTTAKLWLVPVAHTPIPISGRQLSCSTAASSPFLENDYTIIIITVNMFIPGMMK